MATEFSRTTSATMLGVNRGTVTDWIASKGGSAASVDDVIEWRAGDIRVERWSISQRRN